MQIQQTLLDCLADMSFAPDELRPRRYSVEGSAREVWRLGTCALAPRHPGWIKGMGKNPGCIQKLIPRHFIQGPNTECALK